MQNTCGGNGRQVQSLAAKAGPQRKSGGPQVDERDFVLPLLRQAGEEGICKRDFITGGGLCRGRIVSQVSRLIHNLEKIGFIFTHRKMDDCAFVHFVLVSEPLGSADNSPAPRRGWHSQNFNYGKKAQAETVPVQQTLLEVCTTASKSDATFLGSEMGKLLW